ncbi:hypothetical protein V8N76_004556 [Salmonella enterica]
MGKSFSLVPAPTFKADVRIPRPGEEDGIVTFQFAHKSIKELAAIESLEGRSATDFLLEIVKGWALPDPFTPENLDVLQDNYPSATKAIITTYYTELLGNREKN